MLWTWLAAFAETWWFGDVCSRQELKRPETGQYEGAFILFVFLKFCFAEFCSLSSRTIPTFHGSWAYNFRKSSQLDYRHDACEGPIGVTGVSTLVISL
jgi:hypothetical protein